MNVVLGKKRLCPFSPKELENVVRLHLGDLKTMELISKEEKDLGIKKGIFQEDLEKLARHVEEEEKEDQGGKEEFKDFIEDNVESDSDSSGH